MTTTETMFESAPTDPAQDRVTAALEDMGASLSPHAYDRAVARTRKAVDLSGDVSDAQVHAIVDDVISGTQVLQGVAESFR